MSRLIAIGVVLVLGAACCFVLLFAGVLLGAAGGSQAPCGAGSLASDRVPAELVPLFEDASARYDLGQKGPSVLAALTDVESGFGKNMGPSTAGAMGWTQFLPATWRRFGVDADGDARRDPMSAPDAIHAAARYLRHLGAPADWRRALFGYNHADWYVDRVLRRARELSVDDVLAPLECGAPLSIDAERLVGGGRIVPIPGAPGESLDERVLSDVLFLMRRFRVAVTDGYASSGHKAGGEHPLGLAVDLVPGPGGTWDDVDALAKWAEPEQGRPRAPFRWVGYDGDANHGRGHHLHLSWRHGPAPGQRPPAAWVEVISETL